MMEATVTQIQLEKENFKKEAKNMSLEIARQVLNSTLSSLFDNKEKEIIVKKSISKIKQHE